MASIPEKMHKQFAWQRTKHATSGSLADLFVAVDDLAAYLAAQLRQDQRRVRPRVKAELERMVEAGSVRRWTQVYGRSLHDRSDDYFLYPEA